MVGRRVVSVFGVVTTEVEIVGTVVERVGRVVVNDVGVVVAVDEVPVVDAVDDDDGGLLGDDELEGDEEVDPVVDVDPVRARLPLDAAVTRLLRSIVVTSGRSTALVPGMVLSSSATVDEGKTSVRVEPPGPISWRAASRVSTASKPSGSTLFSIGSASRRPYSRSCPHRPYCA